MAALQLQWAFGINSSVANCVHLLPNNENEEIIFYPISNNGVIYNLNTKQQTFLSLHTNLITASILSSDKQLLVLGDSGASNHPSIISIWNVSTRDLISKYELPPNFGVQTLSINKQNTLLSAIINESTPSTDGQSNTIVQHLIVWSLTKSQSTGNNPSESCVELLCQQSIQSTDTNDLYHFITFNEYSSEIVTHGPKIHNFIFWSIIYPQSTEPKDDDQDEMYPELKPYYFIQDTNENANNIDVSSIGKLTASLFFPIQNGPLITATNGGDLIVWKFEDTKKTSKPLQKQNTSQRTINKIITKITRGSINCVSLLPNNDIIALASCTGCVRFYDFQFRVIGWLDYLGDEVISISFPLNVPKYGDITSFDAFVVPDMMIGTKNNKVIKVISPSSSYEDTTHYVVMDTLNTICSAMASHPSKPMIVVGNKNGEIQMWDIMNKSIIKTIALTSSSSSSSASASASQPRPQITDILFSHNGEWLVFGTDTHYLRMYKSKSDTRLEFEEEQFFKTSYDGVIHNMCFSFDGEWFALSQSNRISVYRWWYNINDIKREKNREWTLIGNYVSHQKDIVALHFSLPSALDTPTQRNIPRLFSIGCDNLINEYNLQRSSAGFGLRIKYTFHLKQMSVPTGIQFICGVHARNGDENEIDTTPKYDETSKEWKYIEDQLIVFDDESKIHFYHCPRAIMRPIQSADRKKEDKSNEDNEEEKKEEIEPLVFRRTVIGPSYGAPIKKIIPLNHDCNTFLFCTYSQVIGLMCAPFNGNPYRYFGCIAHPGNINGFEMIRLNDEEYYLVTNGGYDKSILIWKINGDLLQKQVIDCDETRNLNQIYRDLLDDDDPNLYDEMRDYFYYVEIENGGAISTLARSISGCVDIKQITSIFQALSCFLTQNDIERIQKEIMYRFHDNQINFDQFIQFFVNYRSSFEMSMDSLHKSFTKIAIDDLQCFIDVLQRKGDKISRDELMQCLESLTGYTRRQLKSILPNKIDANFFTKNILGLTLQKQTEN